MHKFEVNDLVLVPNVLSGGTGFQYGKITGLKSIGPDNKFNSSAIKKRRGCTLEIERDEEPTIKIPVPLAVLVPEGDGEDFKLEMENGKPREWLSRCVGVVVNLNGCITLCYGQVVKVTVLGETPVFKVEFRSADGGRAPPYDFELSAIEDNEVRPLQMYLGLGQGPVTDERGAIAQMMALGSELQAIVSKENFSAPNWEAMFPEAKIMGPEEQILNESLVRDRMARILKKKGLIKVDPASVTKVRNLEKPRFESPGAVGTIKKNLFPAPVNGPPVVQEEMKASMANSKPVVAEGSRERMFEEFCRLMQQERPTQDQGTYHNWEEAGTEALTAEQQVTRSKKSFIPTLDQLDRHTLIVDGRNYGKCLRSGHATGVVERVFEDMQTILSSREAAQVVAITWFDGRVHHAPMSAFKNNKSFELKFDHTWEQVIWSKNPKFEQENLDDLSVFWECFHTLAMVAAKAYVSEYGILLEIVRQQLNVAVHHLGGMVAFGRLRRTSRIKILQFAAVYIKAVMDVFVRNAQLTRNMSEALKQGKEASECMHHFQNGLVSSLQAVQMEDLHYHRGAYPPMDRIANGRGDSNGRDGRQPRLPEDIKKLVPSDNGKRLCLKFLTKEGCSRSKCHFAHATGQVNLPEDLSGWMVKHYGPLKQ